MTVGLCSTYIIQGHGAYLFMSPWVGDINMVMFCVCVCTCLHRNVCAVVAGTCTISHLTSTLLSLHAHILLVWVQHSATRQKAVLQVKINLILLFGNATKGKFNQYRCTQPCLIYTRASALVAHVALNQLCFECPSLKVKPKHKACNILNL